eukprot:gene18987-20894_t
MRKIEKAQMQYPPKNQLKKKPKKRFPKLFGKRIMHKWDEDGEEVWYEGTVVEVYDEDEYDVDCEFGVKYDNIDGVFEVRLLQDFKRNWLIVVRAANEEEIKACRNYASCCYGYRATPYVGTSVVRFFEIVQVELLLVKKTNHKWSCKICHEKQSVKQVFFKGSGKECRLWVQDMNMKKGKNQHDLAIQCMENGNDVTPLTDNEYLSDVDESKRELPVQDHDASSQDEPDDHDSNWTTERSIFESSKKLKQDSAKYHRKNNSARYQPYPSNKPVEHPPHNDKNKSPFAASEKICYPRKEVGQSPGNQSIHQTLHSIASSSQESQAIAGNVGNSKVNRKNIIHQESKNTQSSNKKATVASKWSQFLTESVDTEEDNIEQTNII